MKNKKLFVGLIFIAIIVTMTACKGAFPQSTIPVEERPNILLIVSDDQRYGTMEYMPRTQELIFDQGVTFERTYITTSRCCPSRSSILTGMYAHTHNVRVNKDKLTKRTVVQYLHENGYYTGIVGKYLNSYPLPEDDEALSEFDRWVVMPSGPSNATYFDTRLNIDGTWQEHEGYQTHILGDYALDFLRESEGRDQPFFLMFTPYAPHVPSTPAPGDEELYLDLPPHRPPNFNPEDMSGKPEWMQELSFLNKKAIARIDDSRLKHNQSLNSLDLTIEDLLAELERQGELDNTLVIYLSDNGFFWGEHRIEKGKIFVYEESTRVPMAIRYPPLIEEAYTETHVVGNIDLAPTILDVAGIPIPDEMDGLSLSQLIKGTDSWRDYILLEGWPISVAYVRDAPFYLALHTGRYVYIETEDDLSELYDLETDPYQLHNLVDDEDYSEEVARFQGILADEREQIRPAPLSSKASWLNMYIEQVGGIEGLWRTYRTSKKLWGGVAAIIILIGMVANRKRIGKLIKRKDANREK